MNPLLTSVEKRTFKVSKMFYKFGQTLLLDISIIISYRLEWGLQFVNDIRSHAQIFIKNH